MNRESVIIQTLDITSPAQVKFFQIKVPREVDHIVGIELGMNWTAEYPLPGNGGNDWHLPLTMRSNLVAGDLKLQSYEQANIFYAGELCLNRNMDYGDFTSQWLVPRPYTHQLESFEEEIRVPGRTTLIQGVYRDTLHTYGLAGYKYTAKIYVWTQSKEQTENEKP